MHNEQFVNLLNSSNPLAFLWEDTPTLTVKQSPYLTLDEQLSILWPDANTPQPVQLPVGNEKLSVEEQQLAAQHCGKTFGQGFNEANGQRAVRSFICHYFRHCDNCLSKRAGELRRRVESAIRDANCDGRIICAIYAGNTRSITRKYGKDNYICCPMDDGTTCIFVRCDADKPAGEKLNLYNLNGIDWKTIAKSPEGRNFSGNLGKEPMTPAPTDSEMVDDANMPEPVMVPEVVIVDLTAAQQNQAFDEAIQQTKHLSPRTAIQVEEALRERMRAYVMACQTKGGRVVFMRNIVKLLKPSDIDWSIKAVSYAPIEWSEINPAPF
jgi:hypothetical protein